MFAWPVPPMTMIKGSLRARYLSSTFGPRTITVNGQTIHQKRHGGLDLPMDVGTPIRTIAAGVVGTVVFDHKDAGHYVEVDHGNGYWSRYLHLSRIDAKKGDQLPAGGQVGLSGGGVGTPGAGRTTGPHLHLEIWKGTPYRGGTPVDPEPLLTTELTELAKAAVEVGQQAVAKGKRVAKRGAATLRRNWLVAALGTLGVGAALWFLFLRPRKTPTLPAPHPNPRRRRRRGMR